MSEIVKDFAKSVMEKINLFILLQIIWLTEFYVLAIFAGKIFLQETFNANINTPLMITKYSNKILVYMMEYNGYVFTLAITIFFAGLSGSCFMYIGVLRKYKFIYTYSDCGVYAGMWMLLIYFTYKVYEVLSIWFLFTHFIALFICSIIKKTREWLETKGITFDNCK